MTFSGQALAEEELSSVGLFQLPLKYMKKCLLALAGPDLSEKGTVEFLGISVMGIMQNRICLHLMDL